MGLPAHTDNWGSCGLRVPETYGQEKLSICTWDWETHHKRHDVASVHNPLPNLQEQPFAKWPPSALPSGARIP